MNNLLLDLSDNKLFLNNSLEIDKKVAFVFGKNGTGKSTLTYLFQEQVTNYDIKCFQGFDGIVGEDKKLNAVILGEANNEIDKKIKNYELNIRQKEAKIIELEKETLKSEENPNNIWKEVVDKQNETELQSKKINSFYTNSAREIKNLINPQVASTSYNNNDFQSEISNALLLTDDDVDIQMNIIKTDVKKASQIEYKTISFEKLIKDTNSLLSKKVQEKEIIPEILGNNAKKEFAEKGLNIHSPNERCSFCGNLISQDRLQKLEGYFSADEVRLLKGELNNNIELINSEINQLERITFDVDNFYIEYIQEVRELKNSYEIKKSEILEFLKKLKVGSENKLKELFEESLKIEVVLPDSVDSELELYNKLVYKNNDSDLELMQNQSKNKLRNHEIKKLLNNFEFEKEKAYLDKLEAQYNLCKDKLDDENNKIIKLEKEISEINLEIEKLQMQTKNEKILADEINDKLELYVNFKLEYFEGIGEKGHYQVKCQNTSELRNITQLSLGEKNIIAFLYFIQKIDEVDNPSINLSKLIIFDDPMTSNDDTMQYLIIEELNNLISKIDSDDKIVIMTHNNHFYLNVKYKYDSYKNNIYFRFMSNGLNTSIIRLTNSEEDFKTNYEALWYELKFLYDNASIDSMLLNPIRRIIETYTKFNCIKKSEMFKHVLGSEKLFNVNSHSIDDLEAELNGKGKNEIIKMMEGCFAGVEALEHFQKHYKT